MKNWSILAIMLLLPALTGFSQSMERMLLSSAGSSFSNASLSVDYSVGEAIVNTFQTGSLTLTQGFQQPPYSGVPVPEPEPIPELSIFPNPGAGEFILNLGPTSADQVTVEVFDMLGKRLWSRSLETPGSQACSFSIDLTHLATGAYHIRIIDAGMSNSLPFVKISK